MTTVLNIGIGGRSFVIAEDAYNKLNRYLDSFRRKTEMGIQTRDVMEDLEERIAELFTEGLAGRAEVVNLNLVNQIIAQLGMPHGERFEEDSTSSFRREQYREQEQYAKKKLYRDSDNKTIGGVCSGLAYYFDIDIVIVRILFLIALLIGSSGFWIYLVFWIITPLAITGRQKCEMRGVPVSIENLEKFSQSKNY